jgi:hypothetical protein
MTGNKDNLSFSLPDQKNYEQSYGLAFKLACEKLSALTDLSEQCRKSGSSYQISNDGRTIVLKYLNRVYQVVLPEINIIPRDGADKVELRDKILILHYLVRAAGTPLSGRLIAYPELQEGASYYPSFFNRSVKPLVDSFGLYPERLLEASREMGGYKANLGDVAVVIPAFDRIPLILVIWRGDAEFPPNANVLFDSTILDYLPAEDINVLCQTVSWKLVRALQAAKY